MDAPSNRLHLSGDDRRAQIALQLSPAFCLKIKAARMVRFEPVLRTEILLTLTRNTCKCKLHTTLRMLAATGDLVL